VQSTAPIATQMIAWSVIGSGALNEVTVPQFDNAFRMI
jgi:hypothetical protein